jgi:hypothetical protein
VAEGEKFSSRDVAQFVLELDATITSWRQTTYAPHPETNSQLPIRPTGIELAVLTSLAQCYGRAIVEDERFLPALDFVAEEGAVELVQRVLWGERCEDLWLANQLCDARLPFEILCSTWPEVFLQESHEALSRLGLPAVAAPRPPDFPRTPD